MRRAFVGISGALGLACGSAANSQQGANIPPTPMSSRDVFGVAPVKPETKEQIERRKHAEVMRSTESIRRKAEAGMAASQTTLGLLYVYGIGVPVDGAEGARWFRNAAEQGDAWAQFFLGRAYARGEGVQQDRDEALRWLNMAKANGLKIPSEEIEVLKKLGIII